MKNPFITVAFILISILNVSGQSFSIQGELKDSLNSGIELATVILTNTADSVMVGFSITNPKGKFKIDDIKEGQYQLNITFLGMQDIQKEITINKDINLGVLNMIVGSSNLETVTVSANLIPIQIKKDTIQYNADAYQTGPADNVEALLKKLPGIEIEDDGTIRAHGEQVENIFVDGKEFFGNDPTIATKNLPAVVIDHVQVYDQKSDMTTFSGIDDGERQKTINLELKEGKKAGYFGNAEAGLGTDSRYETKFNINRFTKRAQLSAIGRINNTNKQGFSNSEYSEFMAGIGGLMRGGRGSTGNSGSGLSSGGLEDGFVRSGSGGLNYNYEPNINVDINSSYFYTDIKNDIQSSVNRTNILNDDNFSTTKSSDLLHKNRNHKINSKIEARLDSTQKIITRIDLSWNNGDSREKSNSSNLTSENILSSQTIYSNISSGDRLNGNINSSYLKRLYKPGRFFSANVRLGLSDSDQNATLNSENLVNTSQTLDLDTIRQDQLVHNYQTNYRIKLSLTEPMGTKNYIEFNASRRNIRNDYNKDFYDIILLDRILNEQITNNYLRDYNYNTIGANYKINKESSNFTIGTNLQHSALNGSLKNEEININQNYFYILPKLNLNFNLSASRSLRIRYNTNIQEPSLNQLNPIPDVSNPLNIYSGNKDLRPSYIHKLNINYNSYSQFNNVGFFSYLSFNYSKNDITNQKVFDQFFRQTTTPINTDYSLNSSAYVNFSAPLKFIKQRINVSNTFSYQDNISFINETENNVHRFTNRINFSLDNWKKDLIDFKLGAHLNFNATKYSVNKDRNQNFMTYQYFIDFNLDLKHDWNLSNYFRNSIYSEEDFGDKLTIQNWRASISKILGKSKKYKIDISAIDILNQNQNINRTTNINYIQDERILSIGRYFMFSLTYSFSGFGQQGNNSRSSGGRGGRIR